MNDRFVSFLLIARWASAVVALMYHLRFLLFVSYDAVHAKTIFSTGFYFLTGLGHESYAVFFILDGILAGLILQRRRATAVSAPAAASRHLGSLYKVFLPGLMFGAVLDLTGTRFFGGTGVYTDFPEFSALALNLPAFLGNIVMLQPFAVPNFGSNSMLYLPSYLFWSFVLFVVFTGASRLRGPQARCVQAALLAAALLVLPYTFLIWAAIWLAGVAVVFLGESRSFRPPLLVAVPLFGAALVLSRLLGPRAGQLREQYADAIIQCGFWLVGIGFAVVAWALYPQQAQEQHRSLPYSAARTADGWSGQTATFTFFFHFPVIMLLVAMDTVLFGQGLAQQPTPATYIRFACLIAACIVTAALATCFAALATASIGFRRRLPG